MAFENPSEAELTRLLIGATSVAVVGASSSSERPSYGIFRKLLAHGYRVVPVNPNETEVLGQRAYPSLAAVPGPIDIVNVFRRPEHTPSIADEAAAIGARVLWLQSGIWNDEAAARARAGGMTVVMDACIGVMLSVLRIPKRG